MVNKRNMYSPAYKGVDYLCKNKASTWNTNWIYLDDPYWLMYDNFLYDNTGILNYMENIYKKFGLVVQLKATRSSYNTYYRLELNVIERVNPISSIGVMLLGLLLQVRFLYFIFQSVHRSLIYNIKHSPIFDRNVIRIIKRFVGNSYYPKYEKPVNHQFMYRNYPDLW